MSDDVINKDSKKSVVPPSTVGRGKRISITNTLEDKFIKIANASLYCGDSIDHYSKWKTPDVIISDGGYGILGFVGDTSDHLGLPEWYEPHIKAWSDATTGAATLWFWNSEIGWAAVHPLLEKYGWRYVNCNTWNKGIGHIAGNVNTKKIRRFPVVTEVCVHYVRDVKINNMTLQTWLRHEWDRTGLKLREANIACEVKDVAVRKYLDKGHLWYFPPGSAFEKLARYANENGNPIGKPYFSRDGKTVLTASDWEKLRAKFTCLLICS